MKKRELATDDFVFCKGSALRISLFEGENAKKSIDENKTYFVKKDFIPIVKNIDKIEVDDNEDVENAFYKIRYLILSYYK